MKNEDIKYLAGKGHICNWCSAQHHCYRINSIKGYASKEADIYNLSVQVFACDKFCRKAEEVKK